MSEDLTVAYMLGVADMRSKLHKQADEIERLRGALTAILNDAGYRNPMRMTTEISDKVLFEAKAVLDGHNI